MCCDILVKILGCPDPQNLLPDDPIPSKNQDLLKPLSSLRKAPPPESFLQISSPVLPPAQKLLDVIGAWHSDLCSTAIYKLYLKELEMYMA